MANILTAIHNIVKKPSAVLNLQQNGANRINVAGLALEEYICNVFAGITTNMDSNEKAKLIATTFSYAGNQNNPPDMILK